MERLTHRDKDGNPHAAMIGYYDIIDKLAEYEEAEEQGLLLRLPCKVGDKVYTACSWGIESGIVGSIEIISDRVFVNNIHGAMIGEAHNIFPTKEEAETALKKMKGEEHDTSVKN